MGHGSFSHGKMGDAWRFISKGKNPTLPSNAAVLIGFLLLLIGTERPDSSVDVSETQMV
jgi:hypothetical protein